MSHEFTDRYQALGIPYPDPATVCRGRCEGVGMVPIYMSKADRGRLRQEDERDPVMVELWEQAERAEPAADGYHFVKCPDCGGTGKVGHGRQSRS